MGKDWSDLFAQAASNQAKSPVKEKGPSGTQGGARWAGGKSGRNSSDFAEVGDSKGHQAMSPIPQAGPARRDVGWSGGKSGRNSNDFAMVMNKGTFQGASPHPQNAPAGYGGASSATPKKGYIGNRGVIAKALANARKVRVAGGR
jgi:hypothetical protein